MQMNLGSAPPPRLVSELIASVEQLLQNIALPKDLWARKGLLSGQTLGIC